MGYRHSARRQYCEIRGQSVGTEEKFTQNVGRAVGAAGIGGLAYGAVKGLQKCNAAGVLKNVKPGKVGLIARRYRSSNSSSVLYIRKKFNCKNK